MGNHCLVISKASKAPPRDSGDYEKAAEISEGLLTNNKHHYAEMDLIPDRGKCKYELLALKLDFGWLLAHISYDSLAEHTA